MTASSSRPDPEEQNLQPTTLPFPVVGIGASAGGLAALQRFFHQMPARSGMAFVVILHLSPDHESTAADILQRVTAMPVTQVKKQTRIEADSIYIISPAHDLIMDDGQLRATPPQRAKGSPPAAIDLFFRTLAQVHGVHSVCVVLSGSGSDGAVGLTRVKEMGGITLAQDPADAEYESMPRAAIATGMVDIVLPAAEMPQRLVDFCENLRRIRMPADIAENLGAQAEETVSEAQRTELALADIMTLVRLQTRHDFKHYKRATVLRRIERRLQVNGLPDIPAYRDYLKTSPQEIPQLLQDLLISVTNFFRDRDAFEVLEREIVPGLFAGRSADDTVRVWVAGCATGEEAYSIAMLLREESDRMPSAPDFQVFATDIDERAIAVARAGFYPGAIVTDVAPARLRQFFVKDAEGFRVVKSLREKILFASHNVLRDPPFSRLDLVCCRNLLIYLDRRAQTGILEMFRFALKPGAGLFLGVSESLDAPGAAFVAVDKKNRIYRAGSGTAPSRTLPTLGGGHADGRLQPTALRDGPPRPMTHAEIHRKALEQLLPPSVLVDARQNILHLSEGAGKYMEHPGGAPSHSLLSNVNPELRLELRTALYTASQTHENVDVRNLKLERGGVPRLLHLSVRPFRSDDGAALALVVFDESNLAMGAEVRPPPDADTRQLVAQLEQEARQLKEHLQNTIEHTETSTEELKASNEELQAINEELRSATEELETSKEELQSMNEELTTVNFELKSKVEETGRINDDLQNLVASTDIATVFVDSGLNIKRFTPQASSLFSLIASDTGRSLLDITHKLDYPSLGDDAQQAFKALRVIERSVLATDGRHFLARFVPYRTGDDKISGAVLTFIDVTVLRAAEETIRRGEEQLRLAAESTRDFAILTTDDAGIITAWNAGAARLFGWTEEEALGQQGAMIFTEEDRAMGVPAAEMQTARDKGRAEDERWHQRKDGTVFFASGVMTPLEAGTERGFARIARDMTLNRQLAVSRELLLAEEQKVRQQAQAAGVLKDEFLAVMSHELKYPLNLIHVNAQLLARLPESREQASIGRAADAILRAATSQAKIIDNLLDLSRVTTGKATFSCARVPLDDTLAAIVNAARPDAEGRGVTLAMLAPPQTVFAYCDQVRVEQIAWNLIANAIKFTPQDGKVTVSVIADTPSGRARIDVADTGRGIEAAFLAHIFEMFSHDARSSSEEERGLGIGLALVRELVLAQGGSVTAQSGGRGKGSVFTVWLPLDDPRAAAPPTAPADPALLEGQKVLLVDDSEDTLGVFSELLELEGAIVTTANSGARALQLIADQDFDLMISDLGMPGMTGYELIRAVRQMPKAASLRAFALSGYGRSTDTAKALEAGFNGHLPKPTTIAVIKERLAQAAPPVTPAGRGTS